MPKYQDCPKCRAKFDVSTFEAGQKFTCGSCGTVVTAHAAPAAAPAVGARVPGGAPPSRPVPAPGKSSVAGSGRGPQYKPLDRGATVAEAAATPRARHSDREDREERRAHLTEKKGLSPAIFAGIAAGVLAAVVGVYFLVKKDDPKKDASTSRPDTTSTASNTGTSATGPSKGTSSSPTAPGKGGTRPAAATSGPVTAPPAGDTVGAVDADRKQTAHPTVAKYRELMVRYQALGATEKAKDIANELINVGDPNDVDAHKLLGDFEFTGDVPEEISFRKYPFVRAVEEAHAKRWFSDREAYDIAVKALEKCKVHADRLENDRVYRALDGARRDIDRDEHFKKYNYDSIFASPYLICYSTDEKIDAEAFISLPTSERRKKLAELDKKKEAYKRILAEKAKIYSQLYAEFLKRYGEACDLHDLMEEYGGRKDLPISKRSFKDGCPLIVWIFSDRAAFDDYHKNVKHDPIHPGIAGYFSPDTGWVYLYDEDNGNREFEINKNVHEGTHQLQHWFMRQKNEWGKAAVPQSFFGEGFAEYMGSVVMDKDRKLTFIGLNRPRLESLDRVRSDLQKLGKPMYVFPVKDLVGFEGYGNVSAWAGEHWGNAGVGLGIFYIQSWAFTYFLNEYENHKYQAKFGEFLSNILNYPKDAQNYGLTKFKAAMGIASENDWKKLDTEFKKYYLDTLARMKTEDIGKQPPGRDDWPSYVPPDLLSPDKQTDQTPDKSPPKDGSKPN